MSEIEIIIPGRPVPAARMTQRGKWIKPNAKRYLAFKDMVRWTAWDAMKKAGLAPIEGPVAVELKAYINGGRPGDVDNIAKAVFDGLNGVVWYDDRQISEMHVYRYEKQDEQRTEVKVWSLGEAEGNDTGGNRKAAG